MEEILGGANLVFNVGSQFVHEEERIIQAWEDYCTAGRMRWKASAW
ncbi:MAG: hypothetical protein ACLUOI_25215 [Eisenbergiella sp.]